MCGAPQNRCAVSRQKGAAIRSHEPVENAGMHILKKHSKRAQRVVTGSLQTSRCFAQFDSPLDAWTNISLGRATLSVDLLKLELLLMGGGGVGRPGRPSRDWGLVRVAIAKRSLKRTPPEFRWNSGGVNKRRQRPTLPRSCPRSTIGAGGLNFCVRNGNRCGPTAIVTGKI